MASPDVSPFADLHLLTVVAREQSYTQAAARLGISRASVSMRIAELERAAGVALVRRTTRSMSLTEAGRQLVESLELPFARIAESFAGVKDLAGAPRGLVRLTAPVALGRQHVVPALTGFLQAHPEVRVELELTDRFVDLAREGFDLAIRHSAEAPESHVAWVLCESRTHLLAAPDYLASRGHPARPEELAGHECVQYLRAGAAQNWAFAPAGSRRAREQVVVRVQGRFLVNNSEALREALQAGLGIGLLPDFSAGAVLAAGALVPVLPGWEPRGFFADRLFAIRPWSAHVPRAVQALVAHLRRAFKAGFTPAA